MKYQSIQMSEFPSVIVDVSSGGSETPPSARVPSKDQEGSSTSFWNSAPPRESLIMEGAPSVSHPNKPPKDELSLDAEAGIREKEEDLDNGKDSDEPSKERGSKEENDLTSSPKLGEADMNPRMEHYISTSESDQENLHSEDNPPETLSTSHSSSNSINETPPNLETPEDMVSSQLPSSLSPSSMSPLAMKTKDGEENKSSLLGSSSPEDEDSEVVFDRVLRSAMKKTPRGVASAGGVARGRDRARGRSLVVSWSLKMLKIPVKGELRGCRITDYYFLGLTLEKLDTDISVQASTLP